MWFRHGLALLGVPPLAGEGGACTLGRLNHRIWSGADGEQPGLDFGAHLGVAVGEAEALLDREDLAQTGRQQQDRRRREFVFGDARSVQRVAAVLRAARKRAAYLAISPWIALR